MHRNNFIITLFANKKMCKYSLSDFYNPSYLHCYTLEAVQDCKVTFIWLWNLSNGVFPSELGTLKCRSKSSWSKRSWRRSVSSSAALGCSRICPVLLKGHSLHCSYRKSECPEGIWISAGVWGGSERFLLLSVLSRARINMDSDQFVLTV